MSDNNETAGSIPVAGDRNIVTVDYSAPLPVSEGKFIDPIPTGTGQFDVRKIKVIQPYSGPKDKFIHGDDYLDRAETQMSKTPGLVYASVFLLMELIRQQEKIPLEINGNKGNFLFFPTLFYVDERVPVPTPTVNLPRKPGSALSQKQPVAPEVKLVVVKRLFIYYIQYIDSFRRWIYGRHFLEGAYDANCLTVCLES